MPNQLTPQVHASSVESARNVTINIPEPAGRSFADLIWFMTPVLMIVVVALCFLILYQVNRDSAKHAVGGSGDGPQAVVPPTPQPTTHERDKTQATGKRDDHQTTDAEAEDVGKRTVAEFINALQTSDDSRRQIIKLLESLGEQPKASGEGGELEIGERLKIVIETLNVAKQLSETLTTLTGVKEQLADVKKQSTDVKKQLAGAEATLAAERKNLEQLTGQVNGKEDEKKKLNQQLVNQKAAGAKLDAEIKGLHDQLAKILDANGVSARTKERLLQGSDTLKQLDAARTKMLENLETIAQKHADAASSATNAAWTSHMNRISRMTNVIPVRRQRLFIVIPLIDRQAYDSVKLAVAPLESEFLTWETKFDGLEIWCFVVQGDRPPDLCRWPQEYDPKEGRNLWAVSGNTGNRLPTQLKYPLTPRGRKEKQAEKYLFVLPVDGTADDFTSFPFPPEAAFEVILVHDRNYADLRANEDEFAKQLNSVQKAAGIKMESLSVLPSKEGEAPDFQGKLRQLVRRSALAMGEMEALKNED